MDIEIYIKSDNNIFKNAVATFGILLACKTNKGIYKSGSRQNIKGPINGRYLQALIISLEKIKKGSGKHNITVYLDNAYITNVINKGILLDMSNRSFFKKDGTDVKNKSEWQQVYNYLQHNKICCRPYKADYEEDIKKLMPG